MRPHLYILDDDGEPVGIEDDPTDPTHAGLFMWAKWFEAHTNKVRQTVIGPYLVSTIFLGTDYSFGFVNDDEPPVLWETMVFASDKKLTMGRSMDLDCRRYSSRQEALDGHQTTCDLVALEVERQEGAAPTVVEKEVTR